MSRRSRARERADVEKAASPPAMAPPPRDRLDVFMTEATRLGFLSPWWRAHRAVERDPDVVVFVGRASGPYEPIQHGVYVSVPEIERAPNQVLERLQHAERQMVEAIEYQQLVHDAMQEMRDAERAAAEPKGAVWRPADLAARLPQDADDPHWTLHRFHQLANLVFSPPPLPERWFGPAPRRGVHT